MNPLRWVWLACQCCQDLQLQSQTSRCDLIAAFLACIELLLQSYNNARPQNRSNRTLKSAQLLLSQTASCTHLKRATNDAINP